MQKMVLYGVGGLYNYGCEAIVRGTAEILRRAVPGSLIRYVTPRPKDDMRRISDTDIEICKLQMGERGMLLRAANRLARAACAPFDSTQIDYASILHDGDVLVSIGGDIYTIPAYLRGRSRYPYFNPLVRAGELARSRGIPEVVIGASIGPFGDYRPAVRYYADHLRGIDLICCRERRSVDYLSSIGVRDNVCLLPDPAFFVEGEEPGDPWDRSECLGINLSPLSLRELSGAQTDADAARFARLVEELMDSTGLRAMLIPHVISPDPGDNDLLFLKKVACAMDAAHRNRAEVVEPTGFLDAKRYLRRCRLAVAARMHCAVNAMCEGVPTILLSYSQKSVGMCEFVYGTDRWVLPLGSAAERLPSLLFELNESAEAVHSSLLGRIRAIREITFSSDSFARLAASIPLGRFQ
ncbi:polysaccharide pyruvyl transferase family protein [Collinsella intestinalis]|uniref:polysaccharide pyruvyl transferase family protein n=1 Tax=Collinsella intestinalis TaxID=147207 RepID=UPI00195DF0BD|nr:polysaccharide pyruvyl transferase family protein [Collinsella intestinalis]MBM6682560.1 polysaccharide pyruvyl transferase family protein [Collinsella intestinalis]